MAQRTKPHIFTRCHREFDPTGSYEIGAYLVFRSRVFGKLFKHLKKARFLRFWCPEADFGSLFGPQSLQKWSPKGSPKPNFLGIRAEVKIEFPPRRELNFQGTGVPKATPKELPKSEQPLREVPELTFEPLGRSLARFGRIWVALGTPLGGVRELTFRGLVGFGRPRGS